MHNAPLPESGSFQEKLLAEVIIRERNGQFAMVSLFGRLLGAIAGIQPKLMTTLLEEYREELFQLRYNPRYRSISRTLAEEEMSKVAEETRLMRRVAAMTVSDTEIEAARKAVHARDKKKKKK